MGISPVLWQFLVKWLHSSALFPVEASTIAPYTDALYFFLVSVSLVGLIFVTLLIFYFSVRYRRDKHPVAVQVEGSTILEATWTIIPLAIFLVVFVWGGLLYFRIYDPPPNAMNIYVVGKQWMWKMQHMEGQREINELHIPLGRPVKLTMTSEDVIHSFFVPAFRIKQDAVPGRYSTTWFEPTKPGKYHLFCAE
ncbi:MAG TPA: cytochrome c oxidase subunit II, partial [Acidobacteriaceae bacterium]|nr:cytochrome c oxidase subunit II [Acidobacteriaceae bacterium]